MSIVGQIKANANYLLQTKNPIREAIVEQGVEVAESTPFEDYPQLVAQIGGGLIIGNLLRGAMERSLAS